MASKKREKQIGVKATAKYIRISATKIERVLALIRGKTYKEALQTLKYLPQKSVLSVWQVLYSAVSNASHNNAAVKDNLEIIEAYANKGPILKRIQPHARGKSFKIEKKLCHITVIVAEKK